MNGLDNVSRSLGVTSPEMVSPKSLKRGQVTIRD